MPVLSSVLIGTTSAELDAWRGRDLSTTAYRFLFLDGANFQVRRGRTVERLPFLCVVGARASDGGMEVLAIEVGDREQKALWADLFQSLARRGLDMGAVELGIMDGLPGVIVSDDDFGINANGIMITETTITGFEGFDPNGKPEFVRARKGMQYSASIDDYVRIMLDGNNGAYANDWLIGDNKTGEIARFELGLKEHTVERTKDGYFVGSNFPVGERLIRNETTFDPKKKDSSPNARRARWEQLMAQHKGRIDAEAAKRLEGDRFDVIEGRDGPTERSLCGTTDTSPRGIPEWNWPPYFPGGTVQAKVADTSLASSMSLWAAMGRPCAPDFVADEFLARRPEYGWMRGLLQDMKTQPWTEFTAGMK